MSTDAAAAPPSASSPAPTTPDPRRWWTLGAVCVATFMLLLDVTIVNVALPDIARDLGSSFSDLQWVIDAYALGLAALLLSWGSIADLVGRKKVFLGGLVGFAIASGLCAAATDPLLLNLARGLQGLVAAAMFATSLALLAATFTGRERGTAFGVWGATTGAAVAVGPLVGGGLIEIASWHWIFLINIPIGLVAALVGWRTISDSRDPNARRVDYLGVITFSGALFALIFGLVRGNAEGWGSTLIVSLLAGAAVLLALFVLVQVRSARGMLDLGLFRVPAFTGAAIAAFGLSAAMFSLFLYITLYLQNVLGFSALESGLRLLPTSLLSFLVAPIAGRLSAHMPTRLLIGGGLITVAVGLFLMRAVDGSREWTDLLPGLLVAGVGIGLVNPPLASTAIGVVDQARSGMASGISNTFRQIGLATGIATFGAIFAALVESKLRDAVVQRAGEQAVANLPPGDVLAQGMPSAFARFPGGEQVFADAWTATFSTVLLVASLVALVCGLLALVLIRSKDFTQQAGAPAGAASSGGAEAGDASSRGPETGEEPGAAVAAAEPTPGPEPEAREPAAPDPTAPVAASEPRAIPPGEDAWRDAPATGRPRSADVASPVIPATASAPGRRPVAGGEPPDPRLEAPNGRAPERADGDVLAVAVRSALADARDAVAAAGRRERERGEAEARRRRAELLADVESEAAERQERLAGLEERIEHLLRELAEREAVVAEHEARSRETRSALWRLVAELQSLAPERDPVPPR